MPGERELFAVNVPNVLPFAVVVDHDTDALPADEPCRLFGDLLHGRFDTVTLFRTPLLNRLVEIRTSMPAHPHFTFLVFTGPLKKFRVSIIQGADNVHHANQIISICDGDISPVDFGTKKSVRLGREKAGVFSVAITSFANREVPNHFHEHITLPILDDAGLTPFGATIQYHSHHRQLANEFTTLTESQSHTGFSRKVESENRCGVILKR